MDERRREERISSPSASFALLSPVGPFVCQVVNLSRLGLGIELPKSTDNGSFDKVDVNTKVTGLLQLGTKSLKVEALVRVRRELFVGLEYSQNSAEFFSTLRAILSPAYIANSIYKLSDDVLQSDIESAYRGDDFEFVIFKSSAGSTSKMVQIYFDGKVVEINEDKSRFVPPALVRASVTQGGMDFLSEFAGLNEAGDTQAIKQFFERVQNILGQWKSCPAELKTIVHHQIHKLS